MGLSARPASREELLLQEMVYRGREALIPHLEESFIVLDDHVVADALDCSPDFLPAFGECRVVLQYRQCIPMRVYAVFHEITSSNFLILVYHLMKNMWETTSHPIT